jgi:hypothetical protein
MGKPRSCRAAAKDGERAGRDVPVLKGAPVLSALLELEKLGVGGPAAAAFEVQRST